MDANMYIVCWLVYVSVFTCPVFMKGCFKDSTDRALDHPECLGLFMCLCFPLVFLQTGCFKDTMEDRALDSLFDTKQDGYGAMKLCAIQAIEVCESVSAYNLHHVHMHIHAAFAQQEWTCVRWWRCIRCCVQFQPKPARDRQIVCILCMWINLHVRVYVNMNVCMYV